jgi:hypothetical protein
MPHKLDPEIWNYLESVTSRFELVVLFGSHARGQAYTSSDIDIMLIDTQFDGWHYYTGVENAPVSFEWPSEYPALDIVCTCPDEFEQRYADDDQMVHRIAEEGVALTEDFAFVDFLRDIRQTN